MNYFLSSILGLSAILEIFSHKNDLILLKKTNLEIMSRFINFYLILDKINSSREHYVYMIHYIHR